MDDIIKMDNGFGTISSLLNGLFVREKGGQFRVILYGNISIFVNMLNKMA